MLGVLPIIQIGKYLQDSLQEVIWNLNLILSKFNSTKVVRVNHLTLWPCSSLGSNLGRPLNPSNISFARTEAYKKSTIPTGQRLLNAYFVEHPEQLAGVLGPGGENLGPGGENLGPGSGEGPRAGEKVGDGAEGVGD